jgi:hypothetical protein
MPGKLWILATRISKLQIGASATISPGTLDKVNDLYKTLVLLYGSTTWVLTKREENRLFVFERKVLLTIYGPKIVDGMCNRRYNFELDSEFNSPNVIGVVKNNRLRCAGHIIRVAEHLPQRALFRAKLEGRRNQERPKMR